MKLVPGGDNLVKDVQCYELFGGIALKNRAFSFFQCLLTELSQCDMPEHDVGGLTLGSVVSCCMTGDFF